MNRMGKKLRGARLFVSLLSLALISAIFLDVYGLMPSFMIKAILYVQFIPSFMKTVSGNGAGLFMGFVLVLVLTALFGRVYCSFLCPLGTTMDLVIKGKSKKRRFTHNKPVPILRYIVLAFTVIVFLSGNLALIDLLDPFSIFGRMMTTLVRPVTVTVNNGLSRLFEMAGFYTLSPVFHIKISGYVLTISFVYVVLILILAFSRGRLYCNTLCPVGTFLGILSRFSLFRLSLSEKICTGCGVCMRNCKAECIDVDHKTIDMSRCVGCFNCLSLCPADSVRFTFRQNVGGAENSSTDNTRRNVIRMMLLFAAGFPGTLAAQVKRPLVFVKNKIPIRRNHPVTPPGSLGISHFTDACTACYLCVTRCPGKVIQPGLAVYGKEGLLMPHLSYSQGYCNFECTICGEVCPTGAILQLSHDEKKTVQVGQVRFIRENCIVITQKTECGACSEHCPTKAVNMAVENGLRVPVVKPNICVGCGACEHACPSLPHKSIYVEGNPVHQKALKPQEKKAEAPQGTEDFPF